jgi:hypothetical protein
MPSSQPASPRRDLVTPAQDEKLGSRLSSALLDLISAIPEPHALPSDSPAARAEQLARLASRRAAGISGGAALLPGPLGLLSLIPDIIGVWRVQAQMVADIAAVHGRTATLGKEQMLYCLFRHLLSHGLSDVVVRSGERFLVRRASLQLLESLAHRVGIQLSQQLVGKAIARYAPLVGAAGVAGYAYFDTRKVARTAMELFASETTIEPAAAAGQAR